MCQSNFHAGMSLKNSPVLLSDNSLTGGLIDQSTLVVGRALVAPNLTWPSFDEINQPKYFQKANDTKVC